MKIKIRIIICCLIIFLSFLIYQEMDGIDKFGIKEIHKTKGETWVSTWDNTHARIWNSQSNDPYDTQFITKYKGEGSWETTGNGIIKVSGEYPRMYVINSKHEWHDVEITIYGMRVLDNNTPWGGIMAYTRTNHMIDDNLCDTRGYGGRFRYDGGIDFEKEISHNKANAQTKSIKYWSNTMPKNIWIGYKFIVYDLPDNSVKLELWIDKTNGLNGGTWIKVNELIDTGSNFGVGKIACKKGISPSLKLTSSDIRIGSETGKPNLAIYFRSDSVGTNGLWYKKASIREIEVS